MHPAIEVCEIPTKPFRDQLPGTSGLRKKTRHFMAPHYVENFVQSVFDTLRPETPSFESQTLVVGGDGRFYNREAIQNIVRLACGNGFGEVLVGRSGILSTPAMSAVIRARRARGGFVLSASHNPGGIDADFGIKFNVSNGGPAPESVTRKIYEKSLAIQRYWIVNCPEIDLQTFATTVVANTRVTVFDPLREYTGLMEQLFDFEALRRLLGGGFRMLFDGMHGVTGPYARHIFEEKLGAPAGTVSRGTPLEDFGGLHPDPNLTHAAELVERMRASDAPDFGAACDGDGDRNLILGRSFFVTPGDSLAVIAAHAAAIPGYRAGLAGLARSMPTSTAVDRVGQALGVPTYETPTGWKFFGNLMDAGLCTICGEESFGTGSNHIREKDGIWAVLCWLSMIAASGQSVVDLTRAHWRRFGRSYFQRHDYEAVDPAAARQMMEALERALPDLTGKAVAGSRVAQVDDFAYRDPVDGAVTEHQGIRIILEDGSRLVYRLSGTGTQGATLRLYVERYSRDAWDRPENEMLAPLVAAARALARLQHFLGREQPDVVT